MAVPMQPRPTNPTSPGALPRPLARSARGCLGAAFVAVAEEKRAEPDSALNMRLLQIERVRPAPRCDCFRKSSAGLARDCWILCALVVYRRSVSLRLARGLRGLRGEGRGKAPDQHRHDRGQNNAVEGRGCVHRSDRRLVAVTGREAELA